MTDEKLPDGERRDKGKRREDAPDILITQSIFPEIEPIFTTAFKPVDQIRDDCLVVLDTNALLVPYLIGKDSLQQIKETYKKLASEKRLIIPGQVAREFAKNRASKLTELYSQFNRKLNTAKHYKGRYPLLQAVNVYESVIELETRIDKLIIDYKKAVEEVLAHIRNWTWNDPVSLVYAEIFSGSVLSDLHLDKEFLESELTRRQLYSIPPGYKDSSKDDSGIGDLLIWLTILEAGKVHEKSVLFVSGDEKPDWFHRSEGIALYPRYELVDEYRRSSKGHTFHIASFARFLDIYGASAGVVEEVREEERKLYLESKILGEFIRKWIDFERAVYEKLTKLNMVSPEQITLNRSLPLRRMLQILLEHEAVSIRFYHMALEIADIRNRVVHGQSDISQEVLESSLKVLDRLLDEL